MIILRRNTLSFQLLTGVLLGSSLITCFITMTTLWRDYEFELDRIEVSLGQIESLYIPSITQNLWNLNDENLNIVMKSMTNLGDISYAHIESNGHIEYSSGTEFPRNPKTKRFDISYDRDGEKYYLGHLVVSAELDSLYSRMMNRVLFVFATSFIKTLVLAFFILALFHRLVTNHLVRIANHLTAFPMQNIDSYEPLRLTKNRIKNNELDHVVKAINSMGTQIVEQFKMRYDAEEKLTQLNTSLEIEVKRRIEENERQQLMIESAARLSSIGEMAGGIAHEINNPLTIIYGYVVMLRKAVNTNTLGPEKIDFIVHKIEATVERITHTIKGLLRLAHNQRDFPIENHSLNSIILDTLAISREKFLSHGISIQLDLPPYDIEASCHPAEIGQILINLLNNSFYEIQDDDSPWILISLSIAPNGMAKISITDSGHGIPIEIRKEILKPFFTTKLPGKGTGLGLSISRAIAQNYMGELYLDVTSFHTKFVVLIPAANTYAYIESSGLQLSAHLR